MTATGAKCLTSHKHDTRFGRAIQRTGELIRSPGELRQLLEICGCGTLDVAISMHSKEPR